MRIDRAFKWKKDALQILGSVISDFHGNYFSCVDEFSQSCCVTHVYTVSEQDIADWMLHEQQAFQNTINTGILSIN